VFYLLEEGDTIAELRVKATSMQRDRLPPPHTAPAENIWCNRKTLK
jgi:hypothetical protein